MGHDPAEYWKSFGSFSNETTKAIEETTGNSAKKLKGDKYDEQVGHAVGKQVGNKSSIQTGWSNSVLQGFSFSTTLGQSTSTTVGNSFSNHTGFKWGMFVGPEMSISSATTVKVTKGAAYSFDTVTKCETTAQKAESTLKKTEMATALTRTIGQEISTLTGFKQVVGGAADAAAVSFSLKSASQMVLKAQLLHLISSSVTRVSGTEAVVFGSAKIRLTTPGQATLNGTVIRVG